MRSPIRTKLMSMFALSIVALAIVGWQGVEGMKEMKAELNRTYNFDVIPMRLIAEANHAIIVLHREMLSHLLEENVPRMGEHRQAIFEQKNILQEKIQKLSEIGGLTERELELIRSLQDYLQRTLPLSESVIELLKAGQHEEASRTIRTVVRPLLAEMDMKMAEFFDIQKLESLVSVQTVNDLYQRNLKRILLFIGAFLVISLCLHLMIARTALQSTAPVQKSLQVKDKRA